MTQFKFAAIAALVAMASLVACSSGGNGGTGGGNGNAGGTGGSSGGTGGSTGGGTAGDVTLANAPFDSACNVENAVSPLYPDEVGHWTATRLTPATYPFTVSKVAYSLVGIQAGACDAELAHKVQVFVSRDGGLDPSPADAGALTLTVANSNGQADFAKVDGGVRGRIFTHTLASPVTLTSGQSLFVAVQMAGRAGGPDDAGITTCLATCRPAGDAGVKSNIDFWSNSATEPYPWADLVGDFGFTQYNTIRAIGR
ncbi:MAG: hypothetical protein IPJ65_34885 [Archangiaceae bacterium]|nr:hypothetical protein [Archangiaceae bacterium]